MGKVFKKVAIATGVAALAGYLAGILTAPKSGRETRADIKSAAQKGVSEAEKQLKKLVGEMGDLLDEAKKRGAQLGEKAGKELNGLTDKAKQARDKAREMLSAIHEGDAQDEDLEKAVAGAREALGHLRAYLKK